MHFNWTYGACAPWDKDAAMLVYQSIHSVKVGILRKVQVK
jgi:hypothetical protein